MVLVRYKLDSRATGDAKPFFSNLSAYFLVSHGSRDPRPDAAVREIAQNWQQIVAAKGVKLPLIGSGTLELNVLPLHLQIKEFAAQAIAFDYQTLEIFPLFLLPGVHAIEDIPREVHLASTLLPDEFHLKLHPYLGAHPQWQPIFTKWKEASPCKGEFSSTQQIATLDTPAQILLAHGSRRPDGNEPVAKLAANLGMIPAYWSVAPTLKERVAELVRKGHRQIGIQPYFLFPGGITDAIADSIADLGREYPQVNIKLGNIIDPAAIAQVLAASTSI